MTDEPMFSLTFQPHLPAEHMVITQNIGTSEPNTVHILKLEQTDLNSQQSVKNCWGKRQAV